MIHVYHSADTPRLQYIFRQVFNVWLNREFTIHTTVSAFKAAEGIKVNYSEEELACDLQIFPDGLLDEIGIRPLAVSPKVIDERFYVCFHDRGTLKYDPFSAIFWMITRYEEYGSLRHDEHDRYTPESSLVFQSGQLHVPVVEEWLSDLCKSLGVKFPDHAFRIDWTVDVDNAYAVYGKPWWRQALATARHF